MIDVTTPRPLNQQIDPVWLREEWKRLEKNEPPVTRESALATMVAAGILTKKGKLTKRYRGK